MHEDITVYHLQPERPATPTDLVVTLQQHIADGIDDGATCLMFSPEAGAQFAAALHAPGCAMAYYYLHGQRNYAMRLDNDVTVPDWTISVHGSTATANACVLQWKNDSWDNLAGYPDPGPALGHLTLARAGGGWMIVGYQSC
jgi:hypothetical protein